VTFNSRLAFAKDALLFDRATTGESGKDSGRITVAFFADRIIVKSFFAAVAFVTLESWFAGAFAFVVAGD
jgi:hypothetical protein